MCWGYKTEVNGNEAQERAGEKVTSEGSPEEGPLEHRSVALF